LRKEIPPNDGLSGTGRLPSPSRITVDVKCETSATAIGGRDGRTRTEDGKTDLQLAVPKELGGPGGEGTNPEQLFAAGYAACFWVQSRLPPSS
jgi:organic hydroperoxide reductase OsmC/OhrA